MVKESPSSGLVIRISISLHIFYQVISTIKLFLRKFYFEAVFFILCCWVRDTIGDYQGANPPKELVLFVCLSGNIPDYVGMPCTLGMVEVVSWV